MMRKMIISRERSLGAGLAVIGHLLVFGGLVVFGMEAGRQELQGEVVFPVDLFQAVQQVPAVSRQENSGEQVVGRYRRELVGGGELPVTHPVSIRVAVRPKKITNPPEARAMITVTGEAALSPTAQPAEKSGSRSPTSPATGMSRGQQDVSSSKGTPHYFQAPAPDYPPLARQRGWQGRVVLEVTVRADGSVAEVNLHTSCGHDLLDRTALATVLRRWLFTPALAEGRPVLARVLVPVQFSLQ